MKRFVTESAGNELFLGLRNGGWFDGSSKIKLQILHSFQKKSRTANDRDVFLE